MITIGTYWISCHYGKELDEALMGIFSIVDFLILAIVSLAVLE